MTLQEKAELTILTVWAAIIAVNLTIISGIIYAVTHFLAKVW